MRGILLARLIREQEAPPVTPPPAAPPAPVQPPATPGQAPSTQPADDLVLKDFNAFKSELKGLETQKSSVISKWEQAIKKKVGGHKVKVLASKAQHFQPSSEYTIDVSDVKIGWHYDKTTGEIAYDLILMDGDKKYFMKPKSAAPTDAPEEPTGEPETTEAPKVPDVPADVPPPENEEPPVPESPAGEPTAAEPTAPSATPEEPTSINPAAPVPGEPEEQPPVKKKKVMPPGVSEVDDSSLINDESYPVQEIINDIRSVVEEVTGRSNMKPYIVGAGSRKNGKIMFEIEIPKSHLRSSAISDSDIELAFHLNEMKAKVSEVYRGQKYNVRVEMKK